MGITILQAKQRLHEKWMELTKDGIDEEIMQALSIADTVLGNYDESLKTDMVAMLTEIQLELDEEIYDYKGADMDSEAYTVERCKDIIQQKINALRGEEK